MSETVNIRYRIEFLSTYTGLGWMELDPTSMTVIKLITDDGKDVTNDGLSYKTISE